MEVDVLVPFPEGFGVLRGSARDEAGAPLAGALVGVREIGALRWSDRGGPDVAVEVGPEGCFELRLDPGRYVVRLHRSAAFAHRDGEGLARAVATIRPQETTDVELLARASGAIRYRVDGAPEGTKVRIALRSSGASSADEAAELRPVTRWGFEGAFEDLAPGTYTLEGSAYRRTDTPVYPDNELPLAAAHVTLPPAGSVSVTLSLAAPAERELRLEGLAPDERAEAWALLPGGRVPPEGFLPAVEPGRFLVPTGGERMAFVARVRADGAERFVVQAGLLAGDLVREFRIPEGRGAIAGALLGAGERAEVEARTLDGGIVARARCDPTTGAFRMEGIPPGRYVLTAFPAPSVEVDVAAGATVEARLGRGEEGR
jgi:hypothetical protein